MFSTSTSRTLRTQALRTVVTLFAAMAMLLTNMTGMAFADSVGVTFDQYDKASSSWTPGLARGYMEGDSVPQRVKFTGLTAESEYTFRFEYLRSKNGHVAFDYLASWNASETTLGSSDAPLGDAAFAWATIPVPQATFDDGLTGAIPDGQRNLGVQGATIVGITVAEFLAATGNETWGRMTVKLTPTGEDVGIVFGAHVSDQGAWPDRTTASAIGGSPYHVRIGAAHVGPDAETELSGLGSRDNQTKVDAPVVAISVAKGLADGQADTVGPGAKVTYEIVASNSGNTAGTVDISDTLSGPGADIAQITDMWWSDDAVCTFEGASGSCEGVSVPADGSTTVTVVATIGDGIDDACGDLALDNRAGSTKDEDGDDNNTVSVTIELSPCEPEPQFEVTKYIQDNDGTWRDADEPGSGPTLAVPTTAYYKVVVVNTGNVDLGGVQLIDHLGVDPELDQEFDFELDPEFDPTIWDIQAVKQPFVSASETDTEPIVEDVASPRFFHLTDDNSTCTIDEPERVFDGALGVGETLTCYFDLPAEEEGPHFDVMQVDACWPAEHCDVRVSYAQKGAQLRPTGAVRLGSVAEQSGFMASGASQRNGSLLRGFDQAHYNGVAFAAPPTTTSTPVVAPSLSLVKTGSTTNAPIGSTVTYDYVVTNNGNVTLTDVGLVDIVDAGSGDATLVLAKATDGITLAPGASKTFTSTHTVTEADLGQVSNVATASATAAGAPLSATDQWVVTVAGIPGIKVDKTAATDAVNFSRSGTTTSTVTYKYLIANTGDVTLSDITLVDDILGPVTLSTTTLAPGMTMVANAEHIVSGADADNGSIVNVALATGIDPTGTAVTGTDTVTVTVIEVLPVTIDRPDGSPLAPAPGPLIPPVQPQVAPATLPATGSKSGVLATWSLIALTLGAFMVQQSNTQVATATRRRRRD